MTETRGKSSGRRGREARVSKRQQAQLKRAKVVWPGLEGGIYRPLSDRDVERIHEGALQVLERVGMGDASPVRPKRNRCSVNLDGVEI